MIEESNLRTFGQRALAARLSHCLRLTPIRYVSQTDVGGQLGVTGATISNWEKWDEGEPPPTADSLAGYYGVRRPWLRYGSGPMYEEEGSPAGVVERTQRRKGRTTAEPRGRRRTEEA